MSKSGGSTGENNPDCVNELTHTNFLTKPVQGRERIQSSQGAWEGSSTGCSFPFENEETWVQKA